MSEYPYFLLGTAFLLSSTVSAQTLVSNPIGQIGTIQQQDIKDIQYLEKEKRAIRDYENLQKGQEQKNKEKTVSKPQKTSERAKPSEYMTKGVYIEKIEVDTSDILRDDEIHLITSDYETANVTMSDLNDMINRINELYLNKGFVTDRAYLPEQTIENGKLRIALLEGKVGDVVISGNRWTKSSHIKNRLDMREGEIFNIQKLENNILVYNRYNDNISIKGNLTAGNKTGTTDISIQTEEKAPYHLTAVVDNAGRETIGKNRAGLIAGHDSLFGYRDKLSVGIYANRYSYTPFIDYNIPINKADGRLGISFSHNNAEIGRGDYRDFNIESRSQNYSIYYSHPIIRELYKEFNSVTSFTYKRAVTSFDGEDLYKDKIPELKTGVNFRYDTEHGIWYLGQSISYAVCGIISSF